MTRFFNTAGPCKSDIHYMVDPLRRVPSLRDLIDRQVYFIVHGPRQVGKTTSLMGLGKALTDEGRFASTLLSVEAGRAYPNDPRQAETAILSAWQMEARAFLPPELRPARYETGEAVGEFLSRWAASCPRPLVVFIDEIDSLQGPALLSVLGQLRGGHKLRPAGFPWSLALVGMRDVRDYKMAAGGSSETHSSSPFNVKEASFLMPGFSRDDVAELYAQHTGDTGQVFTTEAVDRAFELTQGQPWLVNALAREATDRLVTDRGKRVERGHIDQARDMVVARQDTHLDSLAERLREPRVRAVVEPILAGTSLPEVPEDDQRYVEDLGLVRQVGGAGWDIANPIYRNIIPRGLANTAVRSLPTIAPTWLTPTGRLDVDKLLLAFIPFWNQHGQALMGSAPYPEIAPHLVLMAFLHRVVNGGGRVEREYAIGRGRMDLLVEMGEDRLAIEIKVWRPRGIDPRAEGMRQLDEYLAGVGLMSGWLILFDRRARAPRSSVRAARTPGGRSVKVLRLPAPMRQPPPPPARTKRGR